MGEVIDLDARRREETPAMRRRRPTLARAIEEYGPEAIGETQRTGRGSIAHRVNRDPVYSGVGADRAVSGWRVRTACGAAVPRDAPGRDTDLLCLRCFPWWDA